MANTYTDLLKLRMPALGDVGWDDEVNDNMMLLEFALGSLLKSNVIIDGLVVSDGGGLDVDITAGNVVVGGAAYAVGADTLTCTSGVKNWVYVDDTGALQVATTQPAGHYVALALVDAESAAIERIGDPRNFAEGALTIGVDYTPSSYSPDTGETGAINQHLAGIDGRLGILAGLKNKIINGNFDIWQRGVSQTSSGYGSDDRWINLNSGTTKTHSRQAFTPGQTDVPGNPTYFSRTVVASVAGAAYYCFKRQAIEGVHNFAGKTCTLSFYAKADSPKNIAVEFYQVFGGGGSPTIQGIEVNTISLTTAWQKFVVVADIPSIAGKTVDTTSDYLGARIWFDAGSNYDDSTNALGQQSGTFDIARMQLEAGAVATEFEDLPPGIVEILCMRYFEIARGIVNQTNSYKPSFLKVHKRANPTLSNITFQAGTGATFTTFSVGARDYIYQATGHSIDTNFWAWVDAEL
jgi:hypothetical protein